MSKEKPTQKPVRWIGSSLRDLRKFPEDVKDVMGYALLTAQYGGKHIDAKVLRGFCGGLVLEVVEDFDGNTYRAVYTVRFAGFVYVLHAFQKKSKKGRKTPKPDMDMIMSRLKGAKADHEKRQSE